MEPTNQMARIQLDGDRVVLEYERHYPHPPEKVWWALTDSDYLPKWMPVDMQGDRTEGAEIELVFNDAEVERYGVEDRVQPGRINVWQPHDVFEWVWHTDTLRFELEPSDGGTLLRFTTWASTEEAPAYGAAAGYHVCLIRLRIVLDGGSVPPLDEADEMASGLEVRYQEVLATLS